MTRVDVFIYLHFTTDLFNRVRTVIDTGKSWLELRHNFTTFSKGLRARFCLAINEVTLKIIFVIYNNTFPCMKCPKSKTKLFWPLLFNSHLEFKKRVLVTLSANMSDPSVTPNVGRKKLGRHLLCAHSSEKLCLHTK